MGLSDREYYSEDEYGRGAGFGSRGPMSFIAKLIIFTSVCFVVTTIAPPLAEMLRLSKDTVLSGEVWRVLTWGFTAPRDQSGFSIIWFAFQMYILWFVARMVTPLIGNKEFVWLYIACILAGAAAWIVFPINPANALIDGVGIAPEAMFVWAAMRFPHQKILLFGIVPVPFWLLAALVVAYEVWTSVLVASTGTFSASPMLAGIALAASHQYFGWRFTRFRESLAALKPKPKLKVYSPEEAPSAEDELSSRVDEVLAKISREGEASLTSKERKILKQASKQFKDRG